MKNQIIPFNYEGKSIRITMVEGEPWFVAKDICEQLELSDVSQTVEKLDEDEKLIRKLYASGQRRDTWLVNEPGLFRLIFTSIKPEARAFQKWVYHEVLPSLRRTGGYSSDATFVSREKHLKKIREFILDKLDELEHFRANNAKLRLEILLKSSKRLKIEDMKRMYYLSLDVFGGLLELSERELARAFGLSYDRYCHITQLVSDSCTDKTWIEHKKRQQIYQIEPHLGGGDGSEN